MKRNPWKGLVSYEEKDLDNYEFCGRTKAISKYYSLITSNLISTLYGRTGCGKTSMLQAGIFPLLRQESYFPVMCRLSLRNKKSSFADYLVERVKQEITNLGFSCNESNIPVNQVEDQEKYRLWKYFYGHEFHGKDNNVVFPVIVLDQFEEVLINSKDDSLKFLEQVSFLVGDDLLLPDDCYANFRLTISLREDFLYLMEDTIDEGNLRELRDNRMRLTPMSIEEAEEVINLGTEFIKDTDREVIYKSICKLAKNRRGHISTNMLSLICSQLYLLYSKKHGKDLVTADDMKQLSEDPLGEFYRKSIKDLNIETISFIENSLVINGFRRPITKQEFEAKVPILERETLTKGETKILQFIVANDNECVELIHDRLSEVINDRRKQRLAQKDEADRLKANYQKFISRQNPLTPGGRRIWDNKTFSFSLDNSRTNSLQNSSNRTDNASSRAKNTSNKIDNSANEIKNASNGASLQSDLLQQLNNEEGGVEQLFFDKLFRQVSNEGKISLDFGKSYSRDGISGFEIQTIRIKEQIKIKQIDFYRKEKSNESHDYVRVPAYTLDGFRGIRSEYDKETGYETKRVYICDGYTSVGVASIEFGDFKEFDDIKGGLPQKAMYYDSKGDPCKHIDGNYGVKIYYDRFGNENCREFLDSDGNVAPIYNGVCGVMSEYDHDDRIIKQYFIDSVGTRIFDDYHNHGVRYEYHDEPNKYLVTETYYVDCDDSNENRSLIDNPQGYCKEQLQYDNGRIKMQLYYNKYGNEVERKDGDYKYSKLNIGYDEQERIEKIEMCNLSGSVNKIIKFAYYPNGSISNRSYYEKSNNQQDQIELKSISSDNAVHQIGYTYINSGLLKSQEYFDKTGKPMKDSNGFSKIDFEYNDFGFISKCKYYRLEDLKIIEIKYEYDDNEVCKITREEQKPEIIKQSKLLNFFVKKQTVPIRYISNGTWLGKINQRGELITEFFDDNNDYISGTPLTVRRKYDIEGKVREELFYDKNDISPICNNEGFYGWQIEYDIKTGEEFKRIILRENDKIIVAKSNEEYEGKMCNVICYFDEDNNPILCESGYHKKLTSQTDYIDELNCLVVFLDCNNQLCDCKDGYAKQIFEEKKINDTEIRSVFFLGADGTRRTNKARGFHKREQIISIEKNMEVCRLFKDESDNLINVPEGFAKQTCKRYDSIWTFSHFPFDDYNVIRFYDKNEQKVNVDYEGYIKGSPRTFHAYKIVTSLDYSSFFKVSDVSGKTLYRDWAIMWKCVLVPLIIIMALLIFPFYYLYNKLISIFSPKKPSQDSTCSIIRVAQVFDEVQKGNESIVSPAKAMGITDGCWIVKWNHWVYNKYDPDTIEKFEKKFNSAADSKSITIYNPNEKRFFNLCIREKNLGLRLQDAQASVNSVNEMMESAMLLSPDENAEFLRIIYSNLARQHKEVGEYDKAEELYRKQISFIEKQGEDASLHDLADAFDDLGVCMFHLGKNKDAIEMLKKALSIVRIREDDFLLTAAIHNHLAQIYRANEEFGEAEFHYKESAKRIQGIEGIADDILADRIMDIGVMLARQEKYDECIEVTERALTMTTEDNLNLLRSIHSNLAYLYKEKGEFGKAEEHYRERITIMKRQGNETSPHDLADAYDDLGVCLFLLDKNEEAIKKLERALDILKESKGENQLIAAIHNHLAQVFRENEDFGRAEFHYKENIKYLKNLEGVSNDVIADILTKVGVMLVRQEKYDEAIDVTERALSLTSNENIALLTSIHSNLASLYNKKSEYEKAENHYRERISLIEKDGDANYHYLAIAYDDLGVCLHQLNKNDEAVDNLEHALSMVETDENEAQLIAQIHQHLSQVYSAVGASEKANLHNSKYLELMKLLDENCGTDIKPIEK